MATTDRHYYRCRSCCFVVALEGKLESTINVDADGGYRMV